MDGCIDLESDGNLHKRPFPNCPLLRRSRRFDASSSYPHASRQHEGIPHLPPWRSQGPKGIILGSSFKRLCIETMAPGLGCGIQSSAAPCPGKLRKAGCASCLSLPSSPKARPSGLPWAPEAPLFDHPPTASYQSTINRFRPETGHCSMKTPRHNLHERLAPSPFTCREGPTSSSSGTTAGWLCLWFRCMALSAVAENARSIGPKAGRVPRGDVQLRRPHRSP